MGLQNEHTKLEIGKERKRREIKRNKMNLTFTLKSIKFNQIMIHKGRKTVYMLLDFVLQSSITFRFLCS